MSLTQKDFNGIKNLIDVAINENDRLVTRNDIKHLPTKDEFYEKMDEVVGELKAVREEQAVLSKINNKVNNLEERTLKIEHKLKFTPAI